ncbi:MAG: hypothetical protein QOE45_1372 [Frankiaceae bacterium]|jgi:hypothetical protein|nr:hypothetical protein [Frankiaceae bacterium]
MVGQRVRGQRWRRRAAVIVALAVGGTVITGPAQAGPSTPAVRGVVTLAGVPVGGADVTLTVVPGLDAPTGPYRTSPLAVVSTDPSGHFAIPLAVTQAIADQATANGYYANFVVQAFYTQRDGAEQMGQAYSAADFLYSHMAQTTLTSPADDLAADALSTPDAVTLELTAVSAVDGIGTDVADASTGTSGSCRSRYAPYVSVIARENNMDPVGEAHANYDMTAKFDYGVHANTDLNGAMSFGGGPWKVTSSANHMGNKLTMTGATYGPFEAYVVQTVFRYRKEKLEFTDDDGDGHVCRTDYRIVPEGWSGASWQNGANVRSKDSGGQMDAARSKKWAAVFAKNSYWTKSTSRGYKYHTGVDAFGVGLYAQSTWSNQVDIHYTFGPQINDHWLYGSDGPIAKASTVYAW